MIRQKKRLKPEKEAEFCINKQQDKPGFVVKQIPPKGRSVVTTKELNKGEFLLQYPGILLLQMGLKHWKMMRIKRFPIFLLVQGKNKLKLKPHTIFVRSYDATEEPVTGPFCGRLVNHGERHERNCTMKVVCVKNVPFLCLFASKDMAAGRELLYDYGLPDSKLPWKQTPLNTKSPQTTEQQPDISQSSSIPETWPQTVSNTDPLDTPSQRDESTDCDVQKTFPPSGSLRLTCHDCCLLLFQVSIVFCVCV